MPSRRLGSPTAACAAASAPTSAGGPSAATPPPGVHSPVAASAAQAARIEAPSGQHHSFQSGRISPSLAKLKSAAKHEEQVGSDRNRGSQTESSSHMSSYGTSSCAYLPPAPSPTPCHKRSTAEPLEVGSSALRVSVGSHQCGRISSDSRGSPAQLAASTEKTKTFITLLTAPEALSTMPSLSM